MITSKKILSAVFVAALMIFLIAPARAQKGAELPATETQNAEQQQPESLIYCGYLCQAERGKEAQIKAFTGSWEGVLTPEEGGPPPFRIMFTFGADGTVIAVDSGPPNPQLATAELGAWERTGNNEFTIIYKQLIFDSFGNLDSTFKGRVKFKLSRNGNEIQGIVKVNIYDATGNEVIAGAGTIKCTRIRVEPLD